MSYSFAPDTPLLFMLMFTRIGILVMLFPALGERAIPARIKLMVALALTLVIFPLKRGEYGLDLAQPNVLFPALVTEALLGFVLGIAARMATMAVQLAGTVIAAALGLSFATQVDPTQGSQGAVIGTFLSLVAVAMIFATDLHHLIIMALAGSFDALKPGRLPVSGEVSQFLLATASQSFRIGVQLAAPFVVFSLVFSAGLGVMAKLMPQMQVFFIATPLQIALGLLLLVAIIGVMMPVYLEHVGALMRDMNAVAR